MEILKNINKFYSHHLKWMIIQRSIKRIPFRSRYGMELPNLGIGLPIKEKKILKGQKH